VICVLYDYVQIEMLKNEIKKIKTKNRIR